MTGCIRRNGCYERLSRARWTTKNPFNATCTWSGKQLKDCDGSGAQKKRLRCTNPHALIPVSGRHKRDFLWAMSRFHMRLDIRLNRRFLCAAAGHQISLKTQLHSSSRRHPFKGSKKEFFVLSQKGIFIIFTLVFNVLMLIRCIASLQSRQHAHQPEKEEKTKAKRFV